ncbi:hypothetical protein EDD86DRAFT_197963 [Gorgonomyces haynaldii]|nr:hypothetical protein EDD86DRAFT_197963 [Gorgonomyces haynaldii]
MMSSKPYVLSPLSMCSPEPKIERTPSPTLSVHSVQSQPVSLPGISYLLLPPSPERRTYSLPVERIYRSVSPQRNHIQCQVCHKNFHTQFSLKSHMTVHSDEKLHSCHMCKKRFARRHDMLRHERTVHTAEKAYRAMQRLGYA